MIDYILNNFLHAFEKNSSIFEFLGEELLLGFAFIAEFSDYQMTRRVQVQS